MWSSKRRSADWWHERPEWQRFRICWKQNQRCRIGKRGLFDFVETRKGRDFNMRQTSTFMVRRIVDSTLSNLPRYLILYISTEIVSMVDAPFVLEQERHISMIVCRFSGYEPSIYYRSPLRYGWGQYFVLTSVQVSKIHNLATKLIQSIILILCNYSEDVDIICAIVEVAPRLDYIDHGNIKLLISSFLIGRIFFLFFFWEVVVREKKGTSSYMFFYSLPCS